MIADVVDLSDTPVLPQFQGEHFLVCLLGGFRLLRFGQPLDALVVGKAMALLSTLALHLETGVSREELLDLLWPDQDCEQSSVSLHSLIYSLHRRLGVDHAAAAPVIHVNGSYALNRTAGVSTDIARFGALVLEGNRLASSHQDAEAANRYEQALALYRGDLTIGTDVYAVVERERLRATFLTVLAWLADRSYREADYPAALEHATRLLTNDPCREDAHRVIMRARVKLGERSQALRQYRLCEHILRGEFDTAPESLTTELFEQIRVAPSGI